MKTDSSTQIIQAFNSYLLENGKPPASIHQFCVSLKKKETEFYAHFSSFDSLKSEWLLREFNDVKAAIQGDEAFESYGAREKYMAFLYAWVEQAVRSRSLWLLIHPDLKSPWMHSQLFSRLKPAFKSFAQGICREGTDNSEVMQRPFLSDHYPDVMWVQFLFIHQFWIKDDSTEFEKTDSAIEKSVHLVFDLMGNSAFDSAMDFGKFMLGQFR
ncbi:MAG: TetR/AcrR family transcriptional regulator [Bacteroidetes bacterium]|nr:TetR/AcrR family transcriptional regulator [Bacteroidota bacterium]